MQVNPSYCLKAAFHNRQRSGGTVCLIHQPNDVDMEGKTGGRTLFNMQFHEDVACIMIDHVYGFLYV